VIIIKLIDLFSTREWSLVGFVPRYIRKDAKKKEQSEALLQNKLEGDKERKMGRADGSALLYCSAFHLVPHGLPDRGVYPPSSSCGIESRRWAAQTVVGRPTTVFAPLRRRVVLTSTMGCPAATFASPRRRPVSNVDVGLPTSSWAALLRCSCPLVDVGLPMSLWAARLRRSYPLVVVRCRTSVLGCSTVVLPPPRRRVLCDLGVVVGMAESGGWRY